MASGGMRRRAALMTVALAFAACSGGDRRDNAGGQNPGPSTSSLGSASPQPLLTVPGAEPGSASADQGGATTTTWRPAPQPAQVSLGPKRRRL